MFALRAFLIRHTRLAFALVMLACAMKALVPAGYMLDEGSVGGARVLTIHICADASGGDTLRRILIPGHHDSRPDHPDMPCHFSVLAHATLGGADPLLLAAALAVIVALGFAPLVPSTARAIARLRPPLRGPPSAA